MSESSDSGDLALNISLSEPDDSIIFGWQKNIITPPKQPGIIGKLDIDLSAKSLDKMTKDLDDTKKELYGDVEFIPGEIKKGNGGFEYKYEIVEEEGKRKREFYFKGANDNDWTNQTERLKKDPKSDVLGNQMVSILSELGFMSEEEGKEAYENQQANKKIRALNKQRKEYNKFQKEINDYWKSKKENSELKEFNPLKLDKSGGFYNRDKNLESKLGQSFTAFQDQYKEDYYLGSYLGEEGTASDDKQATRSQTYIMESYGITDGNSSLVKLLGKDLTKKFFGYLNKRGLAKDFSENALSGNYGVHGGRRRN